MTTHRPPRAARGAPAPTPAPTPAPAPAADPVQHAEVTEVLPPAGAKPPAKLSKLSLAMQVVQGNITTIEGFDAQVAELVKAHPKDRKYDLSTKDGMKLADAARKEARQKRLAINNMVKDGKKVLNDLKDELVTAAERHVPVLEAIEDNAKSQIEAAERAEDNRKQRHRDAIAAIKLMAEGAATMNSAQVQERFESLDKIIVDESYEEFQQEAAATWTDVHSILNEAKKQAIEREAEAERQREREAARTKAQAAIDAMKALPDQCDGLSADDIHVILDTHLKNVPHADVYGDLLEMAELVHFKVGTTLKELWEQTGLAESRPGPFYWSHPESSDYGKVETLAELNALMDADPNCMEVDEAEFNRLDAIKKAANEVEDAALAEHPFLGIVPEDEGEAEQPAQDQGDFSFVDEDPFAADKAPLRGTQWTEAERATLAAKPAQPLTFNAVPVVRRAPIPRNVPAPVTATAGPLTDAVDKAPAEEDVPDLLVAARRACTAYANLPRNVTIELAPDPIHPPGPACDEFRAAMDALRVAVDFISEFAD
jgi:hypothetical protein